MGDKAPFKWTDFYLQMGGRFRFVAAQIPPGKQDWIDLKNVPKSKTYAEELKEK